jgi:hypothetical protein
VKPPEFAARRIQSVLTPGITRRPKPLMKMKVIVSAVGCMPLLGGVWSFLKVSFCSLLQPLPFSCLQHILPLLVHLAQSEEGFYT